MFQSENDILLRNELTDLQEKHPDKFKIWFTIDKTVKPGKFN